MKENKLILNGILAFSIISLFIAYFIQYVLGHQPCNLCLIERVPYLAAIVLISLVLIFKKFKRILTTIILIFFIFGAVISFYHVGIEQGFFEESMVCNLKNIGTELSKEQLLKQLESVPISCKRVTFRFLGLSLATINTIISIILSGMILKVIKNYAKNE